MIDNQIIIFGGWSNTSGKKFNTINEALEEKNKGKNGSNSKKENKNAVDFNEETEYFYSLNTVNSVWSKSSFDGDLPSCKYNKIT